MREASEQLPPDLIQITLLRILARNYDDVKAAGEFVPIEPENLPDAPLQAIPESGARIDLAGNGHAKPWAVGRRGANDNQEVLRD